MRYRFVGTLMMMGGLLLSSSNMYAATRSRSKDKCIQTKPCPKPKKCPPKVKNPCDDLLGKGPGYANYDLKCGYSAPARINPHCGWDIALSASFIYWHASQEGMDFAIYDTGTTPTNTVGLVFQKFDFEPGFKVAASSYLGTDDWTGTVEYTRLHFSNNESSFAPTTTNGALYSNNYSDDSDITAIALRDTLTQAKSRWQCDLDVIDVETARWMYLGQMLTAAPFMGARGGFLDQRFNVSNLLASGTTFLRNKHRSKSWFVGPRMGLDMNWILGYGLRASGSFAGSLLYQRQRARFDIENSASSTYTNGLVKNTYRHVRSNTELALGLGWGMYPMEEFHFDVFAEYIFQQFEGQNVNRTNVDSLSGSFSSPGNLSYHGLTFTAKVDF